MSLKDKKKKKSQDSLTRLGPQTAEFKPRKGAPHLLLARKRGQTAKILDD